MRARHDDEARNAKPVRIPSLPPPTGPQPTVVVDRRPVAERADEES